MKATVEVEAGICGFKTRGVVTTADGQNVLFDITSDCEKIQEVAKALEAVGQIDAYQEISPSSESVLLKTVRSMLKGCCAGCAVPVGLFKAMQVAAGLALPKDISIILAKKEK